MCDQQTLRSACAYAQSDQSLCYSLEYSMTVKLLTEQNLEYLSLTGGCTGWPESTFVKMPHCWNSHVAADIYLNAKVSQLLLKCYFLLLELKNLLHDIMINKSNDLPSKQHENQTSETYDCRSSTRNVRQPKFEKSQSYSTLHFIESQCYTTLHFIRKRCLTVICFQNQKGRQIQAG